MTRNFKDPIKTKKKMSISKMGDKNPAKRQDVKDKISNTLKGRKLSEETKKKMKNYHKGRHSGDKSNSWKGGISLNILEKQEKIARRKKPEQCEICGAMGRICFDHDHETGEFRGWICVRCNLVLGLVKDNIQLLEEMIKYFKK